MKKIDILVELDSLAKHYDFNPVKSAALNAAIEIRKLRADSTCMWLADEDGVWETACDNRFEFSDGGPPENNFKFCPYCGKKLRVVG